VSLSITRLEKGERKETTKITGKTRIEEERRGSDFTKLQTRENTLTGGAGFQRRKRHVIGATSRLLVGRRKDGSGGIPGAGSKGKSISGIDKP